jgi:hypothetical protein
MPARSPPVTRIGSAGGGEARLVLNVNVAAALARAPICGISNKLRSDNNVQRASKPSQQIDHLENQI